MCKLTLILLWYSILLELLQIFSPVVVTMGTSFSFFLLVKSENRSHLFSFSDATWPNVVLLNVGSVEYLYILVIY